MTREHIIPKSIIKLFEQDRDRGLQFIGRDGGKYIDGESTIKDVCAKCNNETLGKLDAYASDFFAPQCTDFLAPKGEKKIIYDYTLLTRWLMKIAYNSARISLLDHNLLRPHRQYIRGQSPPPKRLALFSMGIIPYEFSGEEQIRHMERFGTPETTLYPDLFRISQAPIPITHADTCVTRAFFLRSIAIFLFIGPKKMRDSDFKELLFGFRQFYPEASPINPRGTSTIVRASSRNAWDVMEFHTSIYPHVFRDATDK